MRQLVRGRFRTTVAYLPRAKNLHLIQRHPRSSATSPAKQIVAFLACLLLLDNAATNAQSVMGGSRWAALRKTLFPLFRVCRFWLSVVAYQPQKGGHPFLERVDVSGLDRVVVLLASGTPVIVATPHLSMAPVAVCYALARRGIPVTINTVAPVFFARLPGVDALDSDEAFRSFLALRAESVLVYAADVAGPGVVGRFLGRYVSLPTFFADIAARMGAAVMVVTDYEYDTEHPKVHLDGPIFADGASPEALTWLIARKIETAIRAHPYEWCPATCFLTHTRFGKTGAVTTLVGTLGNDSEQLGEKYRKRLQTYQGFLVAARPADDLDVASLVEYMDNCAYDLLVLVESGSAREFDELPNVINHVIRGQTDWVAFEPEEGAGSMHPSITSFSLSVVKKSLIKDLAHHNVRRLDASAVRQAVRLGWRCNIIPSTTDLLRIIGRLHRRGMPVQHLVK